MQLTEYAPCRRRIGCEIIQFQDLQIFAALNHRDEAITEGLELVGKQALKVIAVIADVDSFD